MEVLRKNAYFVDTRPHFEALDGLRGVAALLVVFHHVFEGFAFAEAVNGVGDGVIGVLNHGYLAVDFFFLLSGFVISYAYDSRWGCGLSPGGFFCRRLVRLHPMVVLASVVGIAAFLAQGGVRWDGSAVPVSWVMLALLATMLMVPALPGSPAEVRGNGEMFPLNGPAWSLFFEYVGNVVYALVVRRLPTRALAVVALALGVALVWMAVGDVAQMGMFGVGWTLDGLNFWCGLVRMLFPYTFGMLLARRFRPVRVRGAFVIVSAVMASLFAVPCLPQSGGVNWNGVFEAVCIVVVFPVLLWLGASERPVGPRRSALYRLLGDVSYPLYIVHYPLFYLFYAWLVRSGTYSLAGALWQSAAVVGGSLVLAWLALRFYDVPVRRWLSGRRARG